MSSKLVILLGALTIAGLALVDVNYHGHFSDGRIQADVVDALDAANYDTEQIEPQVNDGWVQLDGVVPTEDDHARVAEAVRRSVRGVRGMTNNLRVGTCTDEVLASMKKLVTAAAPDAEVSYLVDNMCNVTLTGWVPTEAIKTAVGDVAGSVQGIRSVNNDIQVGIPKRQIEEKIVDILRIQNIYFDFNSANIRPESLTAIDQIAQLIKQRDDIQVRIEGHTDAVGSEAYNQQLSQARADSVKQALVERGVPVGKVETQGFGESRPVASNDTPEGRAENRRIEFKIL